MTTESCDGVAQTVSLVLLVGLAGEEETTLDGVSLDWTVKELKAHIQATHAGDLKYQSCLLQLVHGSTALDDEDTTLRSLCIENGSQISLLLKQLVSAILISGWSMYTGPGPYGHMDLNFADGSKSHVGGIKESEKFRDMLVNQWNYHTEGSSSYHDGSNSMHNEDRNETTYVPPTSTPELSA
eukprot:TRINITY_DN105604_c0_g1_i1.p1 TRINITY_DN105604_c0_g1~~TRINITY_DN105604_c0_g1_i1.p1  ORF type:complete len:183 (-),score=31.05 TRINITY_DN105604_c0_g1_i1:88-636(-)